MDLSKSLYESENVCLGPIDFEKDPEIIARWTQDAEYLQYLDQEPAMPRSAPQVKKQLEKIEKDSEESHNLFHYTIRLHGDDRLVGLASIRWIDWTNGNGWLQLGIGEAQDRGKGLGREALGLLLGIGFNELNLYRLTAGIQEYNQAALHLFQHYGFIEEVRRRQAVYRFGRRWDHLIYGLLAEEWQR